MFGQTILTTVLEWTWIGEREFKRAIELNPHFADALIPMGRIEEGIRELRPANQIDPRLPYNVAAVYAALRDHDAAIRVARKGLRRAPGT
jgi:tetratricopeptide (TPR) repeat protein